LGILCDQDPNQRALSAVVMGGYHSGTKKCLRSKTPESLTDPFFPRRSPLEAVTHHEEQPMCPVPFDGRTKIGVVVLAGITLQDGS